MVVPDIDLSKISDEEFLIYRAKELRLSSSPASKAWLITAQVLYPNNFGVQFEVYMIEKDARNVKEAARCLGNLIQEFPQEPTLFTEIDAIMAAVQSSSTLFDSPPEDGAVMQDPDAAFLSELFYALPSSIQRGLVLTAAERCTDTMSHCSLLLLLTTHFPETTPLQAPNLVETLLSAEKMSPGPLNPYRKKLICSVLPVLVSGEAGSLPVPSSLLQHLMALALEYYTALLYSNSKCSVGGDVSDPCVVWASVFTCIRELGARLGWTTAQHFTPDANREIILQRIQCAIKGRPMESEDARKELLYVTATVFLHALHDYTRIIAKDNSSGSLVGLTLVEAFTTPASATGGSRSSSVCSDDLDALSPPRSKRSRTSQDNDALVPCVSIGQGEGVFGTGLAQALSTGIKCWDMMHANSKLRADFTGLVERLQLGSALNIFTSDMLLHDARLTETSRDLRLMLSQAQCDAIAPSDVSPNHQQQTPPFSHLELCLKLASVNFALNNLSGAAEAALEAVKLLPPPSATTPPPPTPSSLMLPPSHPATTAPPTELTISTGVERHLHLLPLSRGHCLEFIVTLLINSLRSRVLLHKFYDDLSIGHLLTLVQFEWPKHESIFMEIMTVLFKHGGLIYEQFPLYVTHSEIIEELVYFNTRDGVGLHLEILPQPPHLTKQQRTVSTRGADRGSKHDFKLAMRKQMLRSDESIPHNIITFLNTEGHSIHQNLI